MRPSQRHLAVLATKEEDIQVLDDHRVGDAADHRGMPLPEEVRLLLHILCKPGAGRQPFTAARS